MILLFKTLADVPSSTPAPFTTILGRSRIVVYKKYNLKENGRLRCGQNKA